ncbi:unnamed protein product [Rotaria sordida]|uniref:RNA-dependent RNA polymerase n=1 Tax=Rotaria sordida TaxID=392033 RepID=A0A819E727_9BILA|nr:unnamed protein product [Rotaria sordida]
MYSTKLFYDHTRAFRYTGVVKVWMQGYRAVSLIIKVRSSNKQITIPIRYIQKTLLVNTGHDNQPIQIILMLNSAVKIEENDSDNNRCTRIGNDDIPNSFTDIVSKSNALLLQFDPPVNAWSFLLSLPIVGHTDNNKRQDGNLQINFASFTIENWSNVKITVQPRFNSFKSQYSIEMLHSLGYVFTDKYLTSLNAQQSFIKIERDSMNEFHNFCSHLYKALKENHCLCLDDLIRRNTPNTNKINDTFIDMISADNLYVFIRDITLTPMRVIFNPISRERSNRALCQRGAENYIRVYIREENDETLNTLSANIRSRFKRKMLTDGIMCMNRVYYCVGASTSQMKNFSYWFTALHDGETIERVRAQFGDFTKIQNLATYVARVGLYFSASTSTGIRLNYIDPSTVVLNIPETVASASLSLFNKWRTQAQLWFKRPTNICVFQQKHTAFLIRDIKENGYCFTDGCGLISLGLAQEVAEKIGLSSDIPSVFQIRMAGCKGVLMIDPESSDKDYYVKIRESMVKFPSDDWTLNICDYSRPMPLSLNNQIIRLLSDLGNKFAVFESLQNRMLKPAVWHSPEDTYLNVFDSELINEQQSRYLNVRENLLRNKIPLPINEARNMFGVADVTGKLEYGQCFIQYQMKTKEKTTYKVVKGTVLVTKNPCLYPGDIRKLQAVDVPVLRHCMRDCIVFPTTGIRPHSDEISGSDLDGDQYWVYWGNDLKIDKPVDPLSHSSATKLAVSKITNEMVIDYFLDTIEPNCYSLIADVHTVVADKEKGETIFDLNMINH